MLALGLELPEDTLVNLHGFSAIGETWGKVIGLHDMQFSSDVLYDSALHEIVRLREVPDVFPKSKCSATQDPKRRSSKRTMSGSKATPVNRFAASAHTPPNIN